jgi:hypothetical protein
MKMNLFKTLCVGVAAVWQASVAIADVPATTQAALPHVEFNPPGKAWLDEAAQGRLRQIVREDADVATAFAALRADADKALAVAPSPLRRIVYEGHVSNHPDRVRSVEHLRQDVLNAYALHYAAVVTGEDRYARKAGEVVLAWADAYVPSGNDVNEAKVLPLYVAAGGPARGMWDDAQRARVDAWLRKAADALVKRWRDDAVGNRAANRLRSIVVLGRILRDDALVQFSATRARALMERTLYPDGRSRDFEHRDAMHYHVSACSTLLSLAVALGHPEGQHLYDGYPDAPDGPSIRKSIAYMLPYARGEKVHAEWVNTKVDLDRRRWSEARDPFYEPGKPWNPDDAARVLGPASFFQPDLAPMARAFEARRAAATEHADANDVGESNVFAQAILRALQPPQ